MLPAAPTKKAQAENVTKHFAIIGAGMAGLSCAHQLAHLGHQVTIFEKSRGVSGRISTRTLDTGGCDHGAQYMTARDPGFQALINTWQSKGLVAPWTPHLITIGPAEPRESANVIRYVGTPRMTSPLAALASDHNVMLSVRVAAIRPHDQYWILQDEHGHAVGEGFDSVVFAIPPAQILPIVSGSKPQWIDHAESAKLSPCWTVMATVDHAQAIPFDAAFINNGPLSWVANNASKPGRSQAPLWTLQASAQWTTAHLDQKPEEVSAALASAFEDISGARVSTTVAHRWLYAKATPDPGPRFLWDERLGLAACGDWLAQGNVEGAWLSGLSCATEIG